MSQLFADIGPAGSMCPRCHAMTYRYQATVKGRMVWCWPGGDDGETCAECWGKGIAARERARREAAQATAGIPPLYRGPSLLDHYVRQQKGEDSLKFMERVKEGRESDSRCWGVSQADLPSLAALKKWKPHMGSIFIEGAPGTGKTLLACALANDLVSAVTEYRCTCEACERRWRDDEGVNPDDVFVGVDQREHKGPRPARLRIVGPTDVRFQTEGRLITSLRKPKEEGQHVQQEDDRTKCAKIPVLVFDDLGSQESMMDWHKDVLFSIVDDRYTAARPKRPTIFTSNLALPVLELRYGARFASRVKEMVGPRRYSFVTQWR